ncbi:MAG TPA: DEAD/DEAH box helicase [Bacteroidia bacterium]|nr:DEAD/DEAH box helicase [Bacteroidia bacterium]
MTFRDLNLSTALLNALEDLNFSIPSTIQQRAFAPIMAGSDVLGIAQTGTGKTFAYLLPLLRQWKFSKKRIPEILVMVPTRELVVQVVEEANKLCKYMDCKIIGVYGGTNIKTQMAAIATGADIVIATPGRLQDLLLNKTIHAKMVKKIVIDEVDEMLNLGFRTQLKTIFDLLPERKQMLMFSATVNEEVQILIDYSFNTPVRIEAAPTGTPLSNIQQIGYWVPNYITKINFLEHLLELDSTLTKVLIFAASKRLADDIHLRLEPKFSEQLAVIHSNKAQNTRFKTVDDFESGASRILIATDLIARGLDVSAVSHVINMDVPAVSENYIHRIGRTGRADKPGVSITFITEKDKENKQRVEALMGCEIPMFEIPKEVVISTQLTKEELPVISMKIIEVKQPKVIAKGESHHEKLGKNKKVNIKVTREDAKKKKYGKRYVRSHRS